MSQAEMKPLVEKEMNGLNGLKFLDLVTDHQDDSIVQEEVRASARAAVYRILNKHSNYDEKRAKAYIEGGRALFTSHKVEHCSFNIRRIDQDVLMVEVFEPCTRPRGSMYLYTKQDEKAEYVAFVDPLSVSVYQCPEEEPVTARMSLPFWKHPFEQVPQSTLAPLVKENCKQSTTTPCHEAFHKFVDQVLPELKPNHIRSFRAFVAYADAMTELGSLMYQIDYVKNAMSAERQFQPSSEIRVEIMRGKRVVATFVGRTRSLLAFDASEH